MVAALAAVPLTVLGLILLVVFDVNNLVAAGLLSILLALLPVGLWMGALVAQRPWVSAVLSASTIIVIFSAVLAVWNNLENTEYESFEGCQLASREVLEASPFAPEWLAALPPEVDAVLTDPRGCARVGGLEGMDPDIAAAYAPALEPQPMSMDTFRLVAWTGFILLWVAPLFVLYFCRRRFQPL